MALTRRGDKWLARFSRQVNGQQDETAKRFRLKADAERWLREQAGNAESGNGYVAPSRLTLNWWLDQYLAGLPNVRGRTLTDYTNVLRRYWRPTLGAHRLDQLTTAMIGRELTKLTDAGKSPRTVQQARAVLRQALNAAVSDRKLRVNPAVGKRLSVRQVRTERSVWSAAQVRAFLAAGADGPLVALWTVQLYTGLRPSETLALKWGDLDLTSEEPQLRVMRTLYRPKNGTSWRLEEPKTNGSRRAVPLIPVTVAALKLHRDRQEIERLVAGPRYAGYDFVFAGPTGEPLREDVVSKLWRRATVELNAEARRRSESEGATPILLPSLRLYDARHTCATLLLEAGEPMKVVQEILGHASIVITSNTYSHVRPAMAHRAMARLAAFVGDTDKARTAED